MKWADGGLSQFATAFSIVVLFGASKSKQPVAINLRDPVKFQSAQQQLPSTSPLANHEVRGKNLKGPSKESFNWSTCFGWTVFHYQVTHQTGN